MVRKKIKFFETMSGRHRTKANLNSWFCIILGYKTGNVDKFGKDDKNKLSRLERTLHINLEHRKHKTYCTH